MNDFTASNGARVALRPNGTCLIDLDPDGKRIVIGWPKAELHCETVDALREFFQAEADKRLGRWRWPENPDYVVYPPSEDDDEDAGLCILFEPGGGSSNRYTREWLAGVVDPDGWAVARCARAYFDAHPEPKPWHDPKPGEVWELTVEDGEPAAFYPSKSMSGHFTPVAPNTGTTAIKFDWPLITAGRRIWPEVSS